MADKQDIPAGVFSFYFIDKAVGPVSYLHHGLAFRISVCDIPLIGMDFTVPRDGVGLQRTFCGNLRCNDKWRQKELVAFSRGKQMSAPCKGV